MRLAQSVLSPWIPAGARGLSFVAVLAGGLLVGHAWTFRAADPRSWKFVGLGRSAFRPASIALAAALDMPAGAPGGIMAVGRAAGWIAHIFEQRLAGFLVRPRTKYIGLME